MWMHSTSCGERGNLHVWPKSSIVLDPVLYLNPTRTLLCVPLAFDPRALWDGLWRFFLEAYL